MKNSKKRLGTICIKVALFFFLQISLMYTIRTSFPSSAQIQLQEHTSWNLKQRSSSSSSKTLLSLTHDNYHQDHRQWSFKSKRLSPPPHPTESTNTQEHLQNPILTCDRSNRLSDCCHLRVPTVLDPSTATFFASTTGPTVTEKVKPYPRKSDSSLMSNVREITLTTASSIPPPCQLHHTTPALVLSTGGFTGNLFHDFNDGFIPLFITANAFFPDQDVTLVVTNYNEWWHPKYEAILAQFTKQKIINLDNQTSTHCFPSAVVGLITHGPMTIKPNHGPNTKTMLDFRASLEAGYRQCPAWPAPKVKGRPRLVLVSRAGSVGRVILNQEAVIRAAQEEGFEVFVFEPTPDTYLCQAYRLINSSHVLVGVHGAALTHALFLPRKATLIQIVPLGNDWLAQTFYGSLARGIKLEYVEYNVKPGESSLGDKYGIHHKLVKDAMDVASKNWTALHNVYLKEQDVRLDVHRFRGYLRNAYAKATRLMQEQGLRVRRRNRIRNYVKPIVQN